MFRNSNARRRRRPARKVSRGEPKRTMSPLNTRRVRVALCRKARRRTTARCRRRSSARPANFPREKIPLGIFAIARCLRLLIMSATSTEAGTGVDAFINVGRLCAEANARLTATEKSELMPSLPFGEATFSKFVRIGTDTRLHGPDVQRLLPTHYTTVYHISLLTDEELKQAIAENVIHPEMMRDHLQKWRNAYRERFVVAPSPKEAASNSAVVGLRIDQTKDAVQSDALPSTTRDDNRTMQDERAAASKDAPAPGSVATAAETKGPLTRPPGDDDIPAFLDRRPLSAEDQRLFDMIMAARTAPVRQPAVCARDSTPAAAVLDDDVCGHTRTKHSVARIIRCRQASYRGRLYRHHRRRLSRCQLTFFRPTTNARAR